MVNFNRVFAQTVSWYVCTIATCGFKRVAPEAS